MPRIALLLSLPVLGLGVAACGDQTADLEKQATEELSSIRGYSDAKVDCPSDVDSDKGATFTCTVTGAPTADRLLVCCRIGAPGAALLQPRYRMTATTSRFSAAMRRIWRSPQMR